MTRNSFILSEPFHISEKLKHVHEPLKRKAARVQSVQLSAVNNKFMMRFTACFQNVLILFVLYMTYMTVMTPQPLWFDTTAAFVVLFILIIHPSIHSLALIPYGVRGYIHYIIIYQFTNVSDYIITVQACDVQHVRGTEVICWSNQPREGDVNQSPTSNHKQDNTNICLPSTKQNKMARISELWRAHCHTGEQLITLIWQNKWKQLCGSTGPEVETRALLKPNLLHLLPDFTGSWVNICSASGKVVCTSASFNRLTCECWNDTHSVTLPCVNDREEVRALKSTLITDGVFVVIDWLCIVN